MEKGGYFLVIQYLKGGVGGGGEKEKEKKNDFIYVNPGFLSTYF
jgi:hypothetical protein